MRKYRYVGVMLLLGLLGLGARAFAQEYQLFYTQEWQQGGMINAFVYPQKGIEEARFSLEQVSLRAAGANGYVRARGRGFAYRIPKVKGGDIFLMLIGISALVPADEYQLRVVLTLSDGTQKELVSEQLSVQAGNYTKQTIQMGAQGQSAINNQSSERQAQAQRFYQAIGLFEPKSLYASGAWAMPVEGQWYYTSRYGALREFVYPNGQRSRDFHNGEDFAGLPVGSDVFAVADGRVVLAENRIVTGYTVIVMHAPGFFSLYYHLDSVNVKKEQQVKQGQVVGGIGATGFATGPHLHLTAYSQGQEVDPQWLFKNELINISWLSGTVKALNIR